MAALIARHKAAFRAAAVSQLEVRMRPEGYGVDGGGGSRGQTAAWRVVVSLATGHEHGEEHVEVYREVPSLRPSGSAAVATPDSPLGPPGVPLAFRHADAAVASAHPPGGGSAPTAITASAHAVGDGGGTMIPKPLENMAGGLSGSLHGLLVLGPYPPLQPLQQRRLAARRLAVTYCYDFPSVFEDALREMWAARAAAGVRGLGSG